MKRSNEREGAFNVKKHNLGAIHFQSNEVESANVMYKNDDA